MPHEKDRGGAIDIGSRNRKRRAEKKGKYHGKSRVDKEKQGYFHNSAPYRWEDEKATSDAQKSRTKKEEYKHPKLKSRGLSTE